MTKSLNLVSFYRARDPKTGAPTARVFMKSAKLEWGLGELERALKLVNEGLYLFGSFPKLWMMKGRIVAKFSKICIESYNEFNIHCLSSSALK